MPSFNASRYVRRSLRSILDQDYPNFEIVVVDDGSGDGTADAVAGLDPKIRLIRQQNRGPAAARNNGIANARGEYVAFLDADDLWLPGKLTAQMDYLVAAGSARVVYGRWKEFADADENRLAEESMQLLVPQEIRIDADVSGWIYTKLLTDNVVCIISTMFHRKVFDTIGGFDEKLRTGEDYDFWLRVSRKYEIVKLSRLVALYRQHPGGTTKVPRAINNELLVLEAALSKWGAIGPDGSVLPDKDLVKRLRQLNFGHGYLHYWRGDPCVACRAFWQSMRHGSRSLKTLAYLGMSGMMCQRTRRKKRLEG